MNTVDVIKIQQLAIDQAQKEINNVCQAFASIVEEELNKSIGSGNKYEVFHSGGLKFIIRTVGEKVEPVECCFYDLRPQHKLDGVFQMYIPENKFEFVSNLISHLLSKRLDLIHLNCFVYESEVSNFFKRIKE
jgi:hypothetical protein